MKKNSDYSPVNPPESDGLYAIEGTGVDKKIEERRDGLMMAEESGNFEMERGIDYDAVHGLVGDIRELRKGLLVMLLLFVIFGGLIALDDYYAYRNIEIIDGMEQTTFEEDFNRPPHPHRGHKLQINESAFTVNDFECLQLDTGNWPSERVHCELAYGDGDDSPRYDFVVEHFDDKACQTPNAENPIVRHVASGCYYFEAYDHSYNDVCHGNRTLTISAFYGQGCLTPMPVTAVNVLPED